MVNASSQKNTITHNYTSVGTTGCRSTAFVAADSLPFFPFFFDSVGTSLVDVVVPTLVDTMEVAVVATADETRGSPSRRNTEFLTKNEEFYTTLNGRH